MNCTITGLEPAGSVGGERVVAVSVASVRRPFKGVDQRPIALADC